MSWTGGSAYTLDSDCTLSHEVLAGGGTTVTTGGGAVEIRGITRSVTITASAAETIQCDCVTGPIVLNGTTTATINLYGVAGSVTDNTSAATVTNETVNNTDMATLLTRLPQTIPFSGAGNVEADVQEVDASAPAATGLSSQSTGASAWQTRTIQMTAAAVDDLFSIDSGNTHAGSVSGSVVQEIADNTGAAVVAALKASTAWTAGAAASYNDIIVALYAVARGRIAKATDNYKYYDDDGDVSGGTEVIDHDVTSTARTPA